MDGSKSKDPDKDKLFYKWTLTKPTVANISKWSDATSVVIDFQKHRLIGE
jgi:hypothetical protein